MAGAMLCSAPSHLSLSSRKPQTCSFNPSLSPPHFSRHVNTAQTLRFASKTRSITPVAESISTELSEIYQSCKLWNWRGYNISYLVKGNGPPVLLVHGFGASIAHWRRNIGILAEKSTVYAIDLLGFGASDKPPGFAYTMETWAQLILDFVAEVVKQPTVLVGNSVGSLACVIAASESNGDLVRGLVLLNCAGGMNNKAIVDDWRIKLVLPLLWLIDFLLKQKRIASAIFERAKQRENLKNILISVYGNKEAVDEDLIEGWLKLNCTVLREVQRGLIAELMVKLQNLIIRRPADSDGALDAFVSTVTGPPGPSPISLMPKISVPVLVLWGNEDPFTPLDGPVGKYFFTLPAKIPNLKLFILPGTGHCPHDDRPELVHEKLIPWLEQLSK